MSLCLSIGARGRPCKYCFAKRAAAELAAIEADQQFRARLGRGVPIPTGMTYAEAVMSAELDAHAYRPRRTSVVEDLLSSNSGEVTYHPIQHDGDEW